jgi:hypothetical protein
LLHRKSGWVNEDQMVAILKLSGHRLRPHMAQPQPDLVMVALAPPFAGRVLRAAGTTGRWVVVVPAHITLLLQPADTHPFFFKIHSLPAAAIPGAELRCSRRPSKLGRCVAGYEVCMQKICSRTRGAGVSVIRALRQGSVGCDVPF